MSTFFHKNKKKGALALLVMFLKRGKGAGPLAVMVGMLSFIFIAPSGVVHRIPFFGPILKKFSLRSDLPTDSLESSQRLNEALRQARQKNQLATPGAVFSGNGNVEFYGKSTVGLVQGDDGLPNPDYDALGADADVDGILREEDAKKGEQGVELSENELKSGLSQTEYAEKVQGPVADFKTLKGYGGGFSSGKNNFGSGIRAAGGNNAVQNQLQAANTPDVGLSRPRGAAGGKLSQRQFRKSSARVSGAVGLNRSAGRGTALYQLAEGRAFSVAAAPPPGECDPGANCPAEYASTIGGVPFDGTDPRKGILTADIDGGGGGFDVPGLNDIQGMIDQANQLDAEGQACMQAQETYGPQLDAQNQKIQELSDEMNALNCGQGGCASVSKCKELTNEIKAECQEFNSIAQEYANACPLTGNDFGTHGDCS